MNGPAYTSLEAVIQDEQFPEMDLTLRRGRHIDRADPLYDFILAAQAHLETFYRRYGCDLVHATDGYFHLVPHGTRLPHRHLSSAEMLVGQTLALVYLEPQTLKTGGVLTRTEVAELLTRSVNEERLMKALFKRGHKTQKKAEKDARQAIDQSLRKLAELGFIDLLEGEQLRVRTALLRFVDPVRTATDRAAALRRLIETGFVVVEAQTTEEVEAPPEEDAS